MTASRLAGAAAALLVLLPRLAAAADRLPIALSLEASVVRLPQTPHLAAGGALSARLAFGEAALSLDAPLAEPAGDVGAGVVPLLLLGFARDVGPRTSLHVDGAVGSYAVRLRDYVYGGWRRVTETAAGGRAGIRLHLDAGAGLARGGIRPIAGLWLTVLHVDTGSDRLRAARWGGTVAIVSLSLGAELATPRLDATPGG